MTFSGGGSRRAAAWTLAVCALCVAAARLGCLARRPPCLDAHGERTWFGWSYLHPEPETLFRAVGGALRAGEPIVIVYPSAADETYWWRGMASYFLPGHPVEAVRRAADRPRSTASGPAPVPALVTIRRNGSFRIVRPPG
jgi:hypothetical protein